MTYNAEHAEHAEWVDDLRKATILFPNPTQPVPFCLQRLRSIDTVSTMTPKNGMIETIKSVRLANYSLS